MMHYIVISEEYFTFVKFYLTTDDMELIGEKNVLNILNKFCACFTSHDKYLYKQFYLLDSVFLVFFCA